MGPGSPPTTENPPEDRKGDQRGCGPYFKPVIVLA